MSTIKKFIAASSNFSLKTRIVALLVFILAVVAVMLGILFYSSKNIENSVRRNEFVLSIAATLNQLTAIQERFLKNADSKEAAEFDTVRKKLEKLISENKSAVSKLGSLSSEIPLYLKGFDKTAEVFLYSVKLRNDVIAKTRTVLEKTKNIVSKVEEKIATNLMEGIQQDEAELTLSSASKEFADIQRELIILVNNLYATKNEKAFSESFNKIKETDFPQKKDNLKVVAASCKDSSFNGMAAELANDAEVSLTEAEKMFTNWKESFIQEKELYKIASNINSSSEKILSESAKEIEKAKSYSYSLIAVFFFFGALTIILLSYILVVSIREPIKNVTDSLYDIAAGEGDLTKRLQILGKDEIAELSLNFNSFVEKIEALVKNVKLSVEQVSNSSSEVASGNNQLSSATQEMASSIEELTASVENITNLLKQTFELSNVISGNFDKMSVDADKGSKMLSSMSDAMEFVQSSGAKIAEIVDVVNEIAFQTNLLALNASVEAARAGVHGKGFAVVASEVRNLAVRSAEAVSQIKKLISENSEATNNAGSLSKTTTTILLNLVSKVTESSHHIKDIAKRLKEQSEMMSEINSSISQMDSVTQRNASLVEQLASSAEDLSHVAGKLDREMSKFKVS